MRTKPKPTPTTPSLEQRLLTATEAADYLCCSVWTLAEWRCNGSHSGPNFVKAGRSVRYAKGDLDAWIKRNTCSSTSDDLSERR
jgi:predicted DNA-binding transcriptional regulator AlpA